MNVAHAEHEAGGIALSSLSFYSELSQAQRAGSACPSPVGRGRVSRVQEAFMKFERIDLLLTRFGTRSNF